MNRVAYENTHPGGCRGVRGFPTQGAMQGREVNYTANGTVLKVILFYDDAFKGGQFGLLAHMSDGGRANTRAPAPGCWQNRDIPAGSGYIGRGRQARHLPRGREDSTGGVAAAAVPGGRRRWLGRDERPSAIAGFSTTRYLQCRHVGICGELPASAKKKPTARMRRAQGCGKEDRSAKNTLFSW